MKNELKKITDLTVNELLNNEVILPSLYFEKFDKNAKTYEIAIDDQVFQKEIHELMIEDYNTIENYMKSIITNVKDIGIASKNATNALLNKDTDSLNSIYKQMLSLEKEVKELNNKLFIDDLTSVYNRKWVYNKFLNTQSKFKKDGICVLINVIDYNYIQKEYGVLIANNLLIFISNFLKKSLKEEEINFKIVRYFDDKFLIFISNSDEENINMNITHIKQMLLNTNLKSNSGLFIKANYDFITMKYKEEEDSKEIFEKLFN